MVQQSTGKPDAPAPVSIGPVKKFGRYTLVKKLATGGMAEIWLARQTGVAGFNRFIVVKKILSHLAEEETFKNMFVDEARTSMKLTHPNIVQVYDFGEAESTYFLAMEFISGENLAAIAWRGVKRKRPLSPAFAARIIADSCRALHYAHFRKDDYGKPMDIVHRDISPQNILVTYEGEVKVVDFGIAKAATKSQHTKTGMLKGKFSYMSPEQCLGADIDLRSDIFALGIVLYELCTGKRLFKHESELMILEMITKRRITPPSEVADNISPDLEAIIMKALEKDVTKRYQTAQELQIALEDFLKTDQDAAMNADIAAYMRSLFQDKIDEKRQICELASNDEYLASFHAEEEPEEKRRVITGKAPLRTGAVQVTGMPMTGSMPGGAAPIVHGLNIGTPVQGTGAQMHPQGTYPGMTGMAGAPFTGTGVAIPQPIQEQPSWAPRIVIGVALVVILLASVFLAREIFFRPPVSAPVVQPPPRFGKLEVDSTPPGAVISIFYNGKEALSDPSKQTRTPSELTNLQYGTTYKIRLVKDGYEPLEETFTMNEKQDGKTIKPALKTRPATVIARVAGDNARAVKVLFDGVDQGFGPEVKAVVQPGVVKVTGVLTGETCAANPPAVTVAPGSTAETTIRCGKQVAAEAPKAPTGAVSRIPTPGVGGTTQPKAQPKLPATGDGGCRLLDGVPEGFATIDTIPYSEIWYGTKNLGQTPLAKVKLPSGCLEIRAVNPDTKKEKRAQINIEPNATRRYQFKLE